MGPMPTHGAPTILIALLIHEAGVILGGTLERKKVWNCMENLHQKYGDACCAEQLYILLS
ncbi:hypothetical protein AN396_03560 [Candidatus Epulonipiscium fishelsonii]|uniref:Uncharacterized protein n=1 Tax=Candidatus Epulonipiscium fishelsonii TaxID=77094 RepID=A0ACC8XEC2_9FIRM|nr:hypothetical protein AN396_03560 [Epulopiscium sp. SCG-B11WGA-EpuloA1]